MNIPRQASSRLFAALAVASLAAALSLTQTSAQQAPAKQTPSPNGKIVFASTQGGDNFTSDIYVMDADGRHQTRLTDLPLADDALPIWSPKGDQIAFETNRGGSGYELYLMYADGSNQRPLRSAANGGPLMGSSVEWSPDGTRLAYAAGGNVYVVQVVAPGGGDSTAAPVNISAGKLAGSSDIEVSWAPSSARLVVRNAQICGGCSDLYAVNADGTDRVQVTNGVGFEAHPRWSPAGGLIAYEADRGGRDIYVTSADGTGTETKVSGTVGSFGGAEWAPDGSRLAFRAASTSVYTVSPDGNGLTLLSDVQADGASTIFWSPDATKVAFHSSNASFIDLYVVAADGTSRRALNYTKTRREDEIGYTWQRLPTP